MKIPPTGERAWKPTCLPVFASYQSDSGTRLGDSFAYLYAGSNSAAKPCFEPVQRRSPGKPVELGVIGAIVERQPVLVLVATVKRQFLFDHLFWKQIESSKLIPDQVVLLAPCSRTIKRQPGK